MSIDLRTRSDHEVETVDAATFFDDALPSLLAARADLLAPTAGLRLRDLTIVVSRSDTEGEGVDGEDVDGSAWTLSRDERGSIGVARSGLDDQAAVRLRLTETELGDLVTDQISPVGMMTSGTLALEGGPIGRLMDWWLVLRSVLDERPVHEPGAIRVDADLGRSFTLDDDPSEMREFLEEAGFLHLREVFDVGDMARISADMDEAAPRYVEGDGNSWWATVDGVGRQVVRMQRFDAVSAATAELLDDARLRFVAELPGCGHAALPARGNRVEALFKPIGVTEGISDIPWHKDCSLGRHSYDCCGLTVGVSVTGAGPTSGQLRVIAGSHRAFVWPSLLDTDRIGLPEVPLPTATGDLTVHLSCTLHRAEPPTERERRVLYTGFALPPVDPTATAAAKRRLLGVARERAPLTTSQEPALR
ncbi:MAG TPA: phytanoyl-CoA dioxygenase family protein [Microthrixaceae bacterium]|nr:phytanoyl-CoA dioxygenase family protein [Microthrixaceae bacterium]